MIFEILEENIEKNGGIISLEELWLMFEETSIKDFVDRGTFEKIFEKKSNSFEVFEYEGVQYFALKPSQKSKDVLTLLKLGEETSPLSDIDIQTNLGWSNLRTMRILKYLVNKEICKRDSSYREGNLYYFS